MLWGLNCQFSALLAPKPPVINSQNLHMRHGVVRIPSNIEEVGFQTCLGHCRPRPAVAIGDRRRRLRLYAAVQNTDHRKALPTTR